VGGNLIGDALIAHCQTPSLIIFIFLFHLKKLVRGMRQHFGEVREMLLMMMRLPKRHTERINNVGCMDN
jgi:hypothetical protein